MDGFYSTAEVGSCRYSSSKEGSILGGAGSPKGFLHLYLYMRWDSRSTGDCAVLGSEAAENKHNGFLFLYGSFQSSMFGFLSTKPIHAYMSR
jgi:hypothetical protein